MTDREGNVWLWQDGNGCRKVTYMNGEFTSVVFKKENNISLLIMLLIYLRMSKEEYGLVAMTV